MNILKREHFLLASAVLATLVSVGTDILKREHFLLSSAVLATVVSIGIIISLVVRDFGGLYANALVLTLASVSAIAAYRFARNRFRFTASYIVFTVSILPTMFGWLIFLYLPSFFLISAVAAFTLIRFVVGLLQNQKLNES